MTVNTTQTAWLVKYPAIIPKESEPFILYGFFTTPLALIFVGKTPPSTEQVMRRLRILAIEGKRTNYIKYYQFFKEHIGDKELSDIDADIGGDIVCKYFALYSVPGVQVLGVVERIEIYLT